MKRAAGAIVLSILGVVLAGAFAAHRYLASRELGQARKEAGADLERALALFARHPGAFEFPGQRQDDLSLKAMAQELAAGQKVTIGYLTESERELDKGQRERQVVIRLTNPLHPSLVRYLEELEGRASGAWVREIHVRPSRELPDTYEEAEIVLSKISPASEARKR